MKKIKEFIVKLVRFPNFLPLLIVIIFGLLAGRGLIGPGYFNMHDDLQMMRQLEMEKCFLDLQIPCRWVQDMGYGFGYPLFNFYPPLPYLVGEIFRVVGFSFVDTVKILFVLSFVASGITMYFLAKEFFGKVGGVLSAIFYVWAPYHSVDVYVRGAMNEAWALIWFPLLLLCAYKVIIEKKKIFPWLVGISLGFFGLLTSHNLMVLIFTPVLGIWSLIWIIKEKKWMRIPYLFLSGILAFGLAAFFTLPVLVEQSLVQTDTLVKGYYEYTAHFADFNQLLLSRFWGYGPSIWLENDGMSFQIGHMHWIVSLVIMLLLFYFIVFKKKISFNLLIPTSFFLIVGWFSAFMIHSRSIFIWQKIGPLAFVQFPWRFLTIVVLSFSFAVGSLVLLLPKKISYWAVSLLIALLLILNWNYFLPQNGKLGALTDKEKFTSAAWELQQTAGIFDYLPKYAWTAPKEPQQKGGLTEVMRGQAVVTNPYQNSNSASFDIAVEDESSQVRIGILKFEGWRVYVDGSEIKTFVPEEEQWGRMWIVVPKGVHKITLKFVNTPVRTVANTISIISWVGLGTILTWRKKLFG
ncbi:MAG: hypothetical protein AAB656_01245 [Patescibacteria group bacterium]